MIPFCRTPEEGKAIVDIMASEGLVRGKDGLQLYVMAEIPSNIICADEFCNYFDGFSIGSNDLTQLIYGCGRDNEKLLPLAREYNYETNSESIRRSVSHLIKTAHEHGKKVGICGQAPSDDPEFLRFLVREGIDSISLNFDTFARGRINTWRTEIIETKLDDNDKAQSYKFINDCDDLIDKMRVPRGKLHNLARKQLKAVDSKLLKYSEKFDDIFKKIQELSNNFIKEIDRGNIKDFKEFYDNYNGKIKEFRKEIPAIRKNIRVFGIY